MDAVGRVLGVAVPVALAALVARSRFRAAQRRKQFERCFPVMLRLVTEKRYQEALDLHRDTPALHEHYRLGGEQAAEVARLELESLVGLRRIPEAVLQLGGHLAVRYSAGEWPAEMLDRWLSLYREAGPIPVEKFYFCEACGLDPGMLHLLEHAMRRGCEPPPGLADAHGAVLVVDHHGTRRVGSRAGRPAGR